MNFLSHYYLSKHIEEPHYTLGVILPDLARNNDKALRFKDFALTDEAIAKPVLMLHQGVRFHHLTDHLFHTSPYFDVKSQELKLMLQQYSFKALKKHHYFLAHVALELMLDRLLLKEDPQLCDKFYLLLEQASHSSIADYFAYTGYAAKADQFLAFLKVFNQNKYIHQYIDTESMAFALGRIYYRATGLEISVDKSLLCTFVEEAEEKIFTDYKEIFKALDPVQERISLKK